MRAARAEPAAAPYAGLVNGVLRNIARERQEILGGSDALDDDTPAWLAARWRANYGEATARAIALANRDEPTLDLSVKSDPEGWAARLGGIVLPTGSVRLESHVPVPELPGYGEGEWWVQDAAAALPARLLRASPGMRVVDLCAAPGGKSAEIAVTGASLTAVDRSAERLKRLAVNFERLRLNAEIAVADALSFEAAPFDAVLLDALCTATGTIRRHPDVAWTKRLGDLAPLAALQAQLLDKAVALTKPGGLIVYCTCSLEPEEGESHIAALLRRNPDVRRLPIEARRDRRPRRMRFAGRRSQNPALSFARTDAAHVGSRWFLRRPAQAQKLSAALASRRAACLTAGENARPVFAKRCSPCIRWFGGMALVKAFAAADC